MRTCLQTRTSTCFVVLSSSGAFEWSFVRDLNPQHSTRAVSTRRSRTLREGIEVAAISCDSRRGLSRPPLSGCSAFVGHLPIKLSVRAVLVEHFFSFFLLYTAERSSVVESGGPRHAFWVDKHDVFTRSLYFVRVRGMHAKSCRVLHFSAEKHSARSTNRELSTDDVHTALVFLPHDNFYQVNDIQTNSTIGHKISPSGYCSRCVNPVHETPFPSDTKINHARSQTLLQTGYLKCAELVAKSTAVEVPATGQVGKEEHKRVGDIKRTHGDVCTICDILVHSTAVIDTWYPGLYRQVLPKLPRIKSQ